MRISRFQPYERNTLKGFIEAEFSSGMLLKNLTWHQKGDKEWIGLPAREYKKEDGTKGYANVVDFVDKTTYWKFVNKVLDALKEHLGQGTTTPPQFEEPAGEDSELPF